MISLRILGPLEASVDGKPVALGGAKQRAVLAMLVIHRGGPVSVDRLVDALWSERPPATATKTVQVYISRLRRVLGEEVVVTRGGGYALDQGAVQIDADRFEALAGAANAASDRDDFRAAAEHLREALSLWRGPPLADSRYESFAQAEIRRLEDARVAALEQRIDADLALGRHAALVAELEAAVREHPERERLRGQLMLALYRSGRQREALDAYRDAQRTLADELGLEPGPELRRLEQAILEQDPEIAAPPAGPIARLRERRRGAAVLLLGGGIMLGAAAVAIVAGGLGGGEEPFAEPNSLAVINAETNNVEKTVPTGVEPAEVAADGDYVWVANRADDTLTQVDLATREVAGTASPDTSVGGLGAGGDGVWVADSRGSELVRVDPAFRSVLGSVKLASRPEIFDESQVNPVVVDKRGIWVVSGSAVVLVDPARERVVERVLVGNSPTSIATGFGSVWVADDVDSAVTRIDPASGNTVTATVPVGQSPRGIATGEGAVWVANARDGTVTRLDPGTAGPIATIPVGGNPVGITTGEGAVWVADSSKGTVSRIDPESNEVEATIEVGEAPTRLTVAGGRVWVSVQDRVSVPASTTARDSDFATVLAAEDPGTTDPPIAENFQLQFAICAKLYNYPDRPFPDGAQVRPELAAGDPVVTDQGKTYTFTLRSGQLFSPPSNEPVTAAAFERAFERTLSPETGSFAAELMGDVVGASDYIEGKADHISGIEADGDRLTIELTRPAPDLLARLASPYFCAVPPDTPIDPEGIDTIPTAAPYYVASHDDDRSLVLRRNPNYGGTRPAELEEIRYEIGTSPEDAVAEVEAGRADYMLIDPILAGGIPEEIDRELSSRYGPDSAAGLAGGQQLFTQGGLDVHYFVFNTGRELFSDERLRQAVNYAIDRPALAEHTGVGGSGRPTDQYLPPGLPGFRDALVYPLGGPDLPTALSLAGEGRRNALLYTCNTPDCTRHAGILRSNLDSIGIDLEVKELPLGELFRRIAKPGEQWDLAYSNWFVDVADPANYINVQFGPDNFWPHLSRDPEDLRAMRRAARLHDDQRLRAYARLDRELTERAAFGAVFASGTVSHFLSERMGCEVLHPIYGLDLAALCVEE